MFEYAIAGLALLTLVAGPVAAHLTWRASGFNVFSDRVVLLSGLACALIYGVGGAMVARLSQSAAVQFTAAVTALVSPPLIVGLYFFVMMNWRATVWDRWRHGRPLPNWVDERLLAAWAERTGRPGPSDSPTAGAD